MVHCNPKVNDGALVLFSGGQDSTTCLAWALDHFSRVETVGFSYGQRHATELMSRKTLLDYLPKVTDVWRERLGPDHILDIPILKEITSTALIHDFKITKTESGLLSTFVPGRNLLFFIYSAIVARNRTLRHLVGGMCEVDYSGYPDCRDDALKSLQVTVNLGMGAQFILHTPLMQLGKAEIWKMAEFLGGTIFVDLIRKYTHTCYLGNHTDFHVWGYGCGGCPACRLRADGWDTYVKVYQVKQNCVDRMI